METLRPVQVKHYCTAKITDSLYADTASWCATCLCTWQSHRPDWIQIDIKYFHIVKDKSNDSPQNYTCLISHVITVHIDTRSFHHSGTLSLRLPVCSAFQSNFHSRHHGSAYLPISVLLPEWAICKAMFTSTLRRFTQEWACQVFELSVRSRFTCWREYVSHTFSNSGTHMVVTIELELATTKGGSTWWV